MIKEISFKTCLRVGLQDLLISENEPESIFNFLRFWPAWNQAFALLGILEMICFDLYFGLFLSNRSMKPSRHTKE